MKNPETTARLSQPTPDEFPNVDDLVIEDGKLVDGILTEKQMRLLTEPLYTSWSGPGEGRPFLVVANVGLFYSATKPPLVPDVMLSLDVLAKDLTQKKDNSYFAWIMGKLPDVTLEIVSDRRGREATGKMRDYARIGIPFYVIFDPRRILSRKVLRAFQLDGGRYRAIDPKWFPPVGLGLTLWEGFFEGKKYQWLRWCDKRGQVIPTGRERAIQEETAKEIEQKDKQAEQRAKLEAQRRADRLAAQLRALGIEPVE